MDKNNRRLINQIIKAMNLNSKIEEIKISWINCLNNYDEETLTDMLQMLYVQRRTLEKKDNK